MVKNELPKGFLANGIHCGIKKKRKDLSLIFSETLLMVVESSVLMRRPPDSVR